MRAGFYTVTYYLGFRDDFDVQVQEVINRICALETRSNPNESIRINEMIRKCAETYTHMCALRCYYSAMHDLKLFLAACHTTMS